MLVILHSWSAPYRQHAVGYFGGGMMALPLAGRHPDKVTAVSAWGPPHDLIEFYGVSRWVVFVVALDNLVST